MFGFSLATAGRVLFAVLYFAVSITTAEARSVHAAERFYSRVELGVKPPCGHIGGDEEFPQFGHAKNPRPHLIADLTEVIRGTEFIVQEAADQSFPEYKPLLPFQNRTSRDPPPLT